MLRLTPFTLQHKLDLPPSSKRCLSFRPSYRIFNIMALTLENQFSGESNTGVQCWLLLCTLPSLLLCRHTNNRQLWSLSLLMKSLKYILMAWHCGSTSQWVLGVALYDTLLLHASPMNFGCMCLMSCESLNYWPPKMTLILTSGNPKSLWD